MVTTVILHLEPLGPSSALDELRNLNERVLRALQPYSDELRARMRQAAKLSGEAARAMLEAMRATFERITGPMREAVAAAIELVHWTPRGFTAPVAMRIDTRGRLERRGAEPVRASTWATTMRSFRREPRRA